MRQEKKPEVGRINSVEHMGEKSNRSEELRRIAERNDSKTPRNIHYMTKGQTDLNTWPDIDCGSSTLAP